MDYTSERTMPEIDVCIVSFNSGAVLPACLDSVFAQEGVRMNIVLVDNASRDESFPIATSRDKVRAIRNEANTGFSSGMNQACRQGDSPYVLFLNPDVVLHDRCLATLARTLEQAPREVAAVQPKLLRTETMGSRFLLDSTGMELRLSRLSPRDRGGGQPDDGRYDASVSIFGPTGACALYRRESLKRIAPDGEIFDEFLYAYYEDVDLAWRARRKGFRFRYVPSAAATHDRRNPRSHGPRIDSTAFANRLLIVLKNGRPVDFLAASPAFFLLEPIRWLYRTLTRRSFAWAWRQLAAGTPAMLKKRRVVTSTRDM